MVAANAALGYKCYEDIVIMLIKSGADVDARDKYGWTALMLAKERGRIEIVNLLKHYGAKE